MANRLLIHEIKCIRTTDSGWVDRADEIYLKFDGDKIWPDNIPYKKIENGQTISLRIDELFERRKTLELWESDTYEGIIGSITVSIPTNREVRKEIKSSYGKYIIAYEVKSA